MKGTYGLTQIYTGDVSGVCSALYELGGMIVIHDPLGCNSTYNTHDEVRWYDKPSHIFISGFTERDAIFGNDKKLIDDVVEAAMTLMPRFIVLINSPVPFLVGTDFRALAGLIEKQTRIPSFYVDTNATHDYICGEQGAFSALIGKFFPVENKAVPVSARQKADNGPVRVNVLGMSPLDFAAPTSEISVRAWLSDEGFQLVSCFAMGDSLDQLLRAPAADVDLIVSAAGLTLARDLRERYGIPYVAGVPVAAFAAPLADALRQAAADGENRFPANALRGGEAGCLSLLAGEAVVMTSIAAALSLEGNADDRRYRVICPLENSDELLATELGDRCIETEDGLQAAFADTNDLWADPFYAPIAREGATLHRLPVLAYSGRVFLHEMPDLFRLSPRTLPAMTISHGQPFREPEMEK